MAAAMEKKDQRPNIVIILADDMGFSDIGCYGSEISTPNLDYLASNGVRFSQFYNYARCCPSRASLLTGLHPHQAGIGHMTPPIPGYPAYQGYLNDGCATIAEVLRSCGYLTLMCGKWHVGGVYNVMQNPSSWPIGDKSHPLPIQRGFDRFYGTLEGCANYFKPHTLMTDDRLTEVERGQDYYYTDAISDQAVMMLDRYAGSDRPFFLYVAFTAPHWPLHAPPQDIAKYEGIYRKGWDRLRVERHERLIEAKILDSKWRISPRHPDSPPWADVKLKDWEDSRMAAYAAQIDRMDQGIGRIIEKLGDTGMEENTLVMFLADNGGCAEFLAESGHVRDLVLPMRNGGYPVIGNIPGLRPGSEDTYMSYDLPWANASNTPFRLFKHWVHEGGIATPLIASWPRGITENRTVHSIAHVMDIMPTCIEIAGARYPSTTETGPIHPLEGESFLPVLKGKDWNREKPLVWEHEGNCAVRTTEWKLVRKFAHDWELYNMEQDRTELVDRAGKNRPKLKELVKIYNDFTERCDVTPWDHIKKLAPYQDHMVH